MLIDTRQIVTKSELRENLGKILMLAEKGKEMIISDRGKLIAKVTPFKKKNKRKKVSPKEVDKFMAEMKKLGEKLSRQNPNFDSVKAIREMRREN